MNKIEPRQKKTNFKTTFEGYFEKQSLGKNEQTDRQIVEHVIKCCKPTVIPVR